jgi:hypothetical protein
MIASVVKVVWLIDRKLFRARFRSWAARKLDQHQLAILGDKQETQLTVNYSRVPNSLLDSLCDQYGSDKGGLSGHDNPYPWESHTYTDFYSLLFDTSRAQVDLVFECRIGTNNTNFPSNMGSQGIPGASLRVWRD